MICYPKDANEHEVEALNEYWLLDKTSKIGFKRSVKDIDRNYQKRQCRRLSLLVQKSLFALNTAPFICIDCGCKVPVKSRKYFTQRTQDCTTTTCNQCINKRREKSKFEAQIIIRDFKAENFKAQPYLDSLTIDETIALLCITSSKQSGKLLTINEQDLEITGVKSADQSLLTSLIEKKALTFIQDLPLDVLKANQFLYGSYSHVSYDRMPKRYAYHQHPESVTKGLYLNTLALENGFELRDSEISSVLYQKLQSSPVSLELISKIQRIIRDIQTHKLYILVNEVSSEYAIPIDNSNPLRALLDHLAENYSPQKLNFTFNVTARKTIVHIHKDAPPTYIAKHYFTKSVSRYIEYIESKGFDLEKSWRLPPSLETSPFEAIFCQLYLQGHFNWNRLSAKEIVASWLSNVELSTSAQKVLTGEESSK